MPNHVTNTITFGTDSRSLSAFHKMLEYVKADDSFLGSMDFNKLIPMPASLNIEAGSRGNNGLKIVKEFLREGVNVSLDTFHCSPTNERVAELCEKYRAVVEQDPEVLELGWKYYTNIRDHGASTWYEWSIANWETKWNAYDCIPADKNTDTMRFSTAWSGVPKLIRMLSEKFPSAELTYRWADEDIGHNVGEKTYKNGEIIEQDVPAGGSKKAYEMAAEIRDFDLADWGYVLSKNKITYVYDESRDSVFQDALEAPKKESVKNKTSKSKGKAR